MQNSIDEHPWDHPFLTQDNLKRFRLYSEMIWRQAMDHRRDHTKPLRLAFSVNMAQNMYNWASLAQRYGATAHLIPHPQETTALNQPEWEEFDGEFENIFDGQGFDGRVAPAALRVPVNKVLMEGSNLLDACNRFDGGERLPLLRLLEKHKNIRHEVLTAHSGFYPYFAWASSLAAYDAAFMCSNGFAAYASGMPYCYAPVGGDLQFDCGRGDDYGAALLLAINGAKFVCVSNPHILGHARRLGLSNLAYLPYPMDTERYSPGESPVRAEWEAQWGKGVYVLTTARLDEGVKGHTEDFFLALVDAVNTSQELRFIFLGWGHSAEKFREQVHAAGLSDRIVILKPVGKKRLIEYYRACDIVLDQFVFGYYGATALEAAAVGKPVIMKLRTEQYAPLYAGDVAPVSNVTTPSEMRDALVALAGDRGKRERLGRDMRDWVVRTHGEQVTVPLMLALLQLAADNVAIPDGLDNPLVDEYSPAEIEYHRACMRSQA